MYKMCLYTMYKMYLLIFEETHFSVNLKGWIEKDTFDFDIECNNVTKRCTATK